MSVLSTLYVFACLHVSFLLALFPLKHCWKFHLRIGSVHLKAKYFRIVFQEDFMMCEIHHGGTLKLLLQGSSFHVKCGMSNLVKINSIYFLRKLCRRREMCNVRR